MKGGTRSSSSGENGFNLTLYIYDIPKILFLIFNAAFHADLMSFASSGEVKSEITFAQMLYFVSCSCKESAALAELVKTTVFSSTASVSRNPEKQIIKFNLQ